MHYYAFSPVDMSLPDWGSDQPVAGLLADNPPNSNPADLAVGIHSSLYPWESSQEVDYEVSSLCSHSPYLVEPSVIGRAESVLHCQTPLRATIDAVRGTHRSLPVEKWKRDSMWGGAHQRKSARTPVHTRDQKHVS